MMMWWWWWWCDDDDDDDPNETGQFRENFVPELISFTNLIWVCAVPRGGTRLYIHICILNIMFSCGISSNISFSILTCHLTVYPTLVLPLLFCIATRDEVRGWQKTLETLTWQLGNKRSVPHVHSQAALSSHHFFIDFLVDTCDIYWYLMTCRPFFHPESPQEFQQKQAVPAVQFQVGGTLVPGPGCPVTCGEFVECAFDRRSKQNLLDLQQLGMWTYGTAWWFGTWILWLSIYWECHNPNWFLYFSEWFKPPTSKFFRHVEWWL